MYTSTTVEISDINGTIRLLVTHQNDEFVAISIKDWSCAVLILSRFLPLFFSVGTGIQTVAEVSDLQRGLEPTETETNIHKWGFRFSSPSLSANRSCTMFDACERLCPEAVHTVPYGFSYRPCRSRSWKIHKIWSFHVIVAQEGERNLPKAWFMYVESCCFAH